MTLQNVQKKHKPREQNTINEMIVKKQYNQSLSTSTRVNNTKPICLCIIYDVSNPDIER